MRLDYRLPCAALQPLLTMHAFVGGVARPVCETLPAMLPNLHVRLAGSCTYTFADGRAFAAPKVTLIGPTTASYSAALGPGLAMIATGLLPAGWMALAGLPAGEACDMAIDGAALWGEAAVERLCDSLSDAPGEAMRQARLETFLSLRLPACAAPPRIAVIDRWLERSPSLDLDALCRALGIGPRQLRRLTLDAYGAPPKTLAMKYRCLRAAAALATGGSGALHDALAGFADQAHLTRDFRRFIGWTPAAFARERQCAAAATMLGRHRAGALRPLALLS